MLVLLTTANYPDIMLPAYAQSRLYSIFFIAYLLFGLFFLFNLVLAVFYNKYKTQLELVAEKYINERRTTIKEAFAVLDHQKVGEIEYWVFADFIEILYTELDFSPSSVLKMLQNHEYSDITIDVFERVVTDISVLKKKPKKTPHMFIKRFPAWYSAEGWCTKLKKRMTSKVFEWVMSIITLCNVVGQVFDQLANYYNQSW